MCASGRDAAVVKVQYSDVGVVDERHGEGGNVLFLEGVAVEDHICCTGIILGDLL